MSDPTAEPTYNVTYNTTDDDDYYYITSNETTDDYSNVTSTDDSSDSTQFFTTTNIVIGVCILLFIIIVFIIFYCYCCYKPSKNAKNRTWLAWFCIPFAPFINLFNYCFYYDDRPFTKNERYYTPPNYRAEKRFERNAPTDEFLSLETSVDKFDYLITFPLVSGPYVTPVINQSDFHYRGAVITWKEIAKIWSDVISGSEEEKLSAVDELEQFFIDRYGIETPSLQYQYKYKSWCVIAREAIIDKLSGYGCLQLKISANPKNIFVRIRTPFKLLESQADYLNYKLQIRGEIDPGSESFFNREINQIPVELEEEKKIYSKEEANMILSKLYRAGKISYKDASVNPLKETPIVWSRRVHVFERIADKVPIYNLFLPYMDFTITPHLRYLYQEYPSIRGKTLFLSKDRLYLTKSLIDRCIDIEALVNNRLIKYCTALHDANRGENLTIEILQKRWVYFWLVNSYDVGSPYVTHAAYEKEYNIGFYLRPFSQPLKGIRDYFGEKIALFHAWNGFYIYYLMFPALLGIIIEIIYTVRGYQDVTNKTDWYLQGFNVCIILWNTVYQKAWQRECKVIALKWGTDGFEKDEKNRPHFKGTKKRSLVNNQMELVFSKDERLFWMVFSTFFILCATLLNVVMIAAIFVFEAYLLKKLPNMNELIIVWLVSFIQALQIPFASYFFESFAVYINDTENHQTETNYEDNLIVKNISFQIVSNFGALLFTAFGKKYLFPSRAESCLTDLRILLIVMMIVRTVLYAISLFIPAIKSTFRYLFCWCFTTSTNKAGGGNNSGNSEEDIYYNIADVPDSNHHAADSEENGISSSGGNNYTITGGGEEDTQLLNNANSSSSNNNSQNNIDDEFFIAETDREEYKGVFEDYKFAVIEYGYINLFSVALPVLPIIALILDLIKLRTNAYQLCAQKKRPHVELSEDVGMWESLMNVMTIFGILISTGIITFTTTEYSDTSYSLQLIYFITHQQILFLLKIIVGLFITTQPEWLLEIIKRQAYIIDKYAKSYSDEIDDNSDDDLNSTTNKANNVLFNVNINDTRESERVHLLHIAQAYTNTATNNNNNRNNNSNNNSLVHNNTLKLPSRKLSTEDYETIKTTQTELRALYKQLAYLQERYTFAQQNEIYNSITGVSERITVNNTDNNTSTASSDGGSNITRVPIGILTVKFTELINTTPAMFRTLPPSISSNSSNIGKSNDTSRSNNNEVTEYKEDIIRVKVSFHPYNNNASINNANNVIDPVLLSLSQNNGYYNYSSNSNSKNNTTTNSCLPSYTDDCLPTFTTATATSGNEKKLPYRRYTSSHNHSQQQSKSLLCLPVSLTQCGDCTTDDNNSNNTLNKNNSYSVNVPQYVFPSTDVQCEVSSSTSSSSPKDTYLRNNTSKSASTNNYNNNINVKTSYNTTATAMIPPPPQSINPPLRFDGTPLGPYVPLPTRYCYFLLDIISTQHSPNGQEDVLFTGLIDLAKLPVEQEEVDMTVEMTSLLLLPTTAVSQSVSPTSSPKTGTSKKKNNITNNTNSNDTGRSNRSKAPDFINYDNNNDDNYNTNNRTGNNSPTDINKNNTNNNNITIKPLLKCLVEFKFSKLLMIQNKLSQLQDQIKQLEQCLAYIYSGAGDGDDKNNSSDNCDGNSGSGEIFFDESMGMTTKTIKK